MRKRKELAPPKHLRVKKTRMEDMEIAIPKIEYKVVAQPILETKFKGQVTVIPTVLLFYLHHGELAVASTIIQETMDNGVCKLNTKQFAIRLRMNLQSVYDHLYALRKMGLLFETREGFQYKRAIDFDTVQHLNDMVKNEDSGILSRLRSAVKRKNIKNITADDIRNAYDRFVLDPDHDIEEEEEYD